MGTINPIFIIVINVPNALSRQKRIWQKQVNEERSVRECVQAKNKAPYHAINLTDGCCLGSLVQPKVENVPETMVACHSKTTRTETRVLLIRETCSLRAKLFLRPLETRNGMMLWRLFLYRWCDGWSWWCCKNNRHEVLDVVSCCFPSLFGQFPPFSYPSKPMLRKNLWRRACHPQQNNVQNSSEWN